MKNIINILFTLIFTLSGFAQSNLVLNPGFEESEHTSSGIKELRKVGYLANHWYSPLNKRSPILYNSPEKSVAKANSGSAAIGLVLGGAKQEKTQTDYITGKLSTPLVKGQAYCVTFNLLLHRSSKWVASNIGVLFHNDKGLISNTADLNALKADLYAKNGDYISETKWHEFNGYFVASGGEQYLSFGIFGTEESVEVKSLGLEPYFQLDAFQSKAYYQLDDVSVVAQSEAVDCGCALAPVVKNDTVNYSDKLQPYLFALDASGSMKKEGVFNDLKQNLAELISQLPYGTPITISTFASDSRLVFSGKTNQDTPKEIESLLSEVNLGGGTSVFSGLSMAAKSRETDGLDSARMVLISDGTFSVSNKIEALVRNEYEQRGRQLTIIQIANKAKDIERLAPYETAYISTSPSELRSAIFQIYGTKSTAAVTCECIEDYVDIMNYHFVVDYSGSMKMNKNRVIKTLMRLYEKSPDNAVISITAFSVDAKELYVGRKSELSLSQLEALLRAHDAEGGTDPTPGVAYGLDFAKRMAENRFSHLILITDLSATILNGKVSMKSDIHKMLDSIDMAVSSIAVDLGTKMDVMDSGHAQFDVTSGKFRDVSRNKFENDLFKTLRSACDYTTQAYHYNPSKDNVKKGAKKSLKFIMKELLGVGISIG